MNNKEILKQRWNNTNKRLDKFMKKYNKINKRTQDKLQQVFDGIDFTIDEVNKYITPKTREKFERQVEEYKEQGILTGYFGYNVKNLLSKSKIKNIDMLEVLLQGCYMLEMKSINDLEMNLFQETANEVYTQGRQEVEPTKKRKSYIVPELLITSILALPNSRGYIWTDYKEATAEYNASEIRRQVLINMYQNKPLDINDYEFSNIIEKQNKRYINKKKDEQQEDKYSGMLDDELTGLANQMLLKAYEDAGVSKVRFIATIDDKTTEMCDSLNNQIFYIGEMNTFKRYSKNAGRIIEAQVYGLQLGVNLPPINDGFHWCRSTIYPDK